MKLKYLLLTFLSLGLITRIPPANARSDIQNTNINHVSLSTKTNQNSFQIAQNKPIRVPTGNGEIIQDIRIDFVDESGNPTEGKTKTELIKQEFKQSLGDTYDAELAQFGLMGVNNLVVVERATLTLEPKAIGNEAVMVVTVKENSSFFFSLGTTIRSATALQGTTRPNTVNPMSNKGKGFGSGFRVGVNNLGGNNQSLTLGVEAGSKILGFDLDYRNYLRHDRGYGVNFFNHRSFESEFDGGEIDVDLIGGDDPWVHRIGGGVEYFLPIAREFKSAIGITYQLVSIRDDLISDELRNVDELGNTLTFSDDAQDGLLTVSFVTALDRRNQTLNPTQGYRLLLQTDQSIPVGDASILYNRLSANYTHFFPVDFFKFTEGQPTFVVNFQGGTIIGDLPGYEAFTLGGSSSVRGYSKGELGTGRSFVQASAEYRFPMFQLNVLQKDWDIGGSLFFDYGTDLGSGDTVKGEPATFRDKPGEGFGYGFGLRTTGPIGLFKLEFALNDEGDGKVIFAVGDRF